MVPREYVYDDVSEDAFKRITSRQKRVKQAYDIAHNPEILERLFVRCASDQQRAMFSRIARMFEDFKRQHSEGVDEDTENMYTEKKVSFLRSVIGPRLATLARIPNLSDPETVAIKWFNINPNIVIVIDDCTTGIEHLKNCDEILELIFRGRHSMCTTILALHNETSILPKARMNISVSIFTDPGTARDFVTRAGFQKKKRDEMFRYADKVLKDVAPFTKMLYLGDAPSLISVETHGAFSAVSDLVRSFARDIAQSTTTTIEPWMK